MDQLFQLLASSLVSYVVSTEHNSLVVLFPPPYHTVVIQTQIWYFMSDFKNACNGFPGCVQIFTKI